MTEEEAKAMVAEAQPNEKGCLEVLDNAEF